MDVNAETGLPAWTYFDDDYFALERAKIFASSWQIACHRSDIAEAGQYATLNFMGALVFVMRGDDGRARAFRNVCPHRAARLLDDSFGRCKSRIVCPYHSWTFDLKGSLVGMPAREGYGPLDPSALNLKPLELGECGGFIFVRMGEGGPPFEEYAAPLRKTFEIYDTANMRALGRVSLRERAVNWKVAVENYIDSLHLTAAHPGLKALAGDSYTLDVVNGAYHIKSQIADQPGQPASVRAYNKFLPEADYLPPERRRTWRYIQRWPNLAFDIYPDQFDFMQFIPLSPGRTLLREIPYAHPDARREMRASRYLNWRVNRRVNLEDKDIIERAQAGLESGHYEPGPISRDEICLRHFTARMRKELPLCDERTRPPRESIQRLMRE